MACPTINLWNYLAKPENITGEYIFSTNIWSFFGQNASKIAVD